MPCSILHTNGWLYPKGYTETAQENTFTSTNLIAKTSIKSPQTSLFFTLQPQNVIAEAQANQPDILFIFIAYANKIKEKTHTTITALYTDPVYLEATSLQAQQENSASTDLYPDWYKPHRDQIGIGIYFKQGDKAYRAITATNKTPNRQDRKHVESWQVALILGRKNALRWVEKRRVDAEATTPFGTFSAEDRQIVLVNLLTQAIDHNIRILIDALIEIAKSNLFNAGHPHAINVDFQLLIDFLDALNIKLDLLVPISYAADRVHFVIAWGIGGIGCRHRYVPPLGNDVDFEFKTPEKAII